MKFEPTHINGVLEEAIKELKIQEKLTIGDVFNDWQKIVGKQIAEKAKPHSLKRGCLVLKTESSTWSQELSFIEEELILKVNGQAGSKVVSKIRFITK